ncbi:glycoside hydrolase family 127 protein [Paraflavisolibacter sp. H34]|uniref:glycoside hydrolase family 127 protein n=1 Tax=Huijunlia imazamoxiresistens TaxID=3127457 RepID=UPI003019152B
MKQLVYGLIACCLLAKSGYSQEGSLTTSALQPFPLTSVRLAESPFKQAQQTDLQYILSLDPDRLLAPYLREAGLAPKAKSYPNWENTGLDGHIGGHYLSALSNMWAATSSPAVKKRLDYMISELERCQKAAGNGYIGGVPGGKAMWEEVAAGRIDAGSFSLNKKWVPWYNIHKIYAGLVDAYKIGGNAKAKELLVQLSDWCLGLTKNLSDEQVQTMLRSEHGGMNEVFADVADITGDKKYLTLAQRFSHRTILNPLLEHRDALNGIHANTQIPKVIGFIRVAEAGGEKSWADAADYFWQTVVDHRTVSIGGNSVREHFHPANNFSSMVESPEGPETCNSYNMLKLTKHLFLDQPSVRYMDYYERTVYNHILSSQHPRGGFVYFTPMRPRHYRVYSQPDQGMWCCVGSGLENHGKYGELIYAHKGSDLYVNLFIPSTLVWKEGGLALVQSTRFPQEEGSTLKLTLKKPTAFALHLRRPSWVKGAMKVLVNGQAVPVSADKEGYVSVQRQWKTGDVVRLSLPMQTKAEKLPDGSNWVSFVHGPIVLAAVTDSTDLKGLRADSSRMGHIAGGPLYPVQDAPVLVTSGTDYEKYLQPVAGKPLTFTLSGLQSNPYKNLKLVPFYGIHDARYMVYWPVSTPEELQKRQAAIREQEAARLALEARTADQVAPGEQQPESDHFIKGEKSEAGVYRDRHFRHAPAPGWFSYDLKNANRDARILRVTYFGGDKGRSFDISVNGTVLKTERLEDKGNAFYDLDYELPEAVRNSPVLTVKFAAQPGSVAGGIYYVRLLK